jgi:hypothetical protein
MKRKLILVALTLAAWGLSAATASACSCAEYGTPVCAAYGRADAVFTGVVTDFRKLPDEPRSPPVALVRFTVEESFKGVSAREVEATTLSGTSCDLGIRKGQRWLVFAFRDGAGGRLAVHPCTSTRQLDGPDEDLDYLRDRRRGAAEQSVHGRLKLRGYELLAGMKVRADDGRQTFEAKTDAAGHFAIHLPRGGDYKVTAVVPFSAAAMSQTAKVKADPTDDQTLIEYDVGVAAGQCEYHEVDVYKVDLHATAELSGKVVDDLGRPVTRGYVRLLKVAPGEGSNPEEGYARINEDGSFKLEGVAVGSFYLVLNPRGDAPDDYDAPHPKTFYPGVPDQSQASPIVVTEGLKLNDLVLRVPPALRERVLEGVVVWPDGKPAAANVLLQEAGKNRSVRTATTDASGRFSLKLYGEFKYEVMATTSGEKHAESEKVKVPEAEDGARLRLVVKPR